MSLTRANGASSLLSLAAEIRCNIWFMLFQHAYLWFPHKLVLSGKPRTMKNEIANLISILFTCKTLNIEATPFLTANVMVIMNTNKRYFERLHHLSRQNFLSSIHHLALAQSSFRQPPDLQMVLDAVTLLRVLILGPSPLFWTQHDDESGTFLDYLHGGPLGDGPGRFDEQAQDIVREFRQKVDQTHTNYKWIRQLLDKPGRQFKILVRFDSVHLRWSQANPAYKGAVVRTLIDIENLQTLERAVIANDDRGVDGDYPITSCSQLQRWVCPDEQANHSAVEARPISDCNARHMWEDDLISGCLADPYWRQPCS